MSSLNVNPDAALGVIFEGVILLAGFAADASWPRTCLLVNQFAQTLKEDTTSPTSSQVHVLPAHPSLIKPHLVSQLIIRHDFDSLGRRVSDAVFLHEVV